MIMRVAKCLFVIYSLLLLVACGGGGSIERGPDGSGGGGGAVPDPAESTIVMAIVDSMGNPSTQLDANNNLTVRATVRNSNTTPIAGELVTFVIGPDSLASFLNNDTGTASTNAEGVAEITLLVGSQTGSGAVTASISSGQMASVSFDATGSTTMPNEPNLTLSLIGENDTPNNVLTEAEPLTLVTTFVDEQSNPRAGELLTFTVSPDTLARFDNDTGTALTNDSGVATIGLIVGDISGSGTITVTSADDISETIGFTSEGPAVTVDAPFSLGLFASQAQLSSSGSDTIELQAIVKNEQNVLLPNVEVSFSANANASLSAVSTATDENGIATATLSTINEPENRIVTVTASVENQPQLSQVLEIAVVGTELNIIGPNSVIVGDSTDVSVLLENSDNVGILGETITITAVDENGMDVTDSVITSDSFVTSNDGRIAFAFSAPVSGVYRLSAAALSAAAVFDIVVQQDQFAFVDAPDINDINEDLPLNSFHPLTVRWLKDNAPFVGGTVELSISRGEIEDASQVTDANGEVEFNVRSDNAGLASVLATGSDGDGNEVTARIDVSFIATEVFSVLVDATPDAIGPDGQTSTVSAVVRDSQGNRVGNKRINFSLSDVSNGSLSPAQVTTDRRGIASTVYTSNAVSSNEAVQVTASTEGVTGVASLTVGDRPFDISLGTGRLIQSPNPSSYRKEFSVFVTDADGNPVPNAEISLSITPLSITEGFTFIKGTWFYDDEAQVHFPSGSSASLTPTTTCDNEDVNFNGILDFGEDTNNDGQLTPGNAASITPAEVSTDENGQALVFVEYPRQFGAWVRTKITARGQSGGSESRESMFFTLAVALEDLIVEGSPPPSSPYGTGTNCADIE